MSGARVTSEPGYPVAHVSRAESDDGALILVRVRYRVGDERLERVLPPDEASRQRDEQIAQDDFGSGPWFEYLREGQTMVRVAESMADAARSLDLAPGVVPALYGNVSKTLNSRDMIAVPDPSRSTGYRLIRFAVEVPWTYLDARIVWLEVVAFDLDPGAGVAYATFAAEARVPPGEPVRVSLEPPPSDEHTIATDERATKGSSGRGYNTGTMVARPPADAMPFRASGPPGPGALSSAPLSTPPRQHGSILPPPPPPATASVPPPQPTTPPGASFRGPDAARPLLRRTSSPPPVEASPPSPRPAPRPERVGLALLWHDPERIDAMAEAPLLASGPAEKKPPPPTNRKRKRAATSLPASSPTETVVEVMRHSHTHPASSVQTTVQESLYEDEPEPMLMLDGDLHVSFDVRAELEALVSLARPLAGPGSPLAEELDHAEALLATPLEGAPDVAQRMADKIRQTWRDSKRSLPEDYLARATQRVLLTKRAYLEVQLFGASYLRAEFETAEGGGRTQRFVTYLPAEVATQLPLFVSFSCRLIATGHLRQDGAEDRPICLRSVALARCIKPTESR